MSKLEIVVALGMITLLIAFAFPPIADATLDGTEQRLTLDEGETDRVTEGLSAELVTSGQNEATVRVFDVESSAGETHTINESDSQEYDVEGDLVTVTLEDSLSNSATVLVEYPRTYGWTPAGTAFIRSMPIVLAIVAFIVIMGIVAVAVKP